jgi:hypothetical protein
MMHGNNNIRVRGGGTPTQIYQKNIIQSKKWKEKLSRIGLEPATIGDITRLSRKLPFLRN